MTRRLRFIPCYRAAAALASALSAAVVFVGSDYAAAQGSPDASCPGPSPGTTLTEGDNRLAQTFTALATGALTRAEVNVIKVGTAGDWIVQILAVDGTGTPTNMVLSSALVPDASVPADESTLAVTFAAPAQVVAGQQYAVSVTRPGSDNVGVGIRDGNPCPGGFFSGGPPPTGAFSEIDPDFDMVFAVFVEPPSPPEPEPQPQPQPAASRNVSLDANRNKVKEGKRVLLSGRIVETRQGACAANQPVALQRKKPSQSAFTTVEQLTTDAVGSFSAKEKVKKTFEYRAQVAESPTCASQTSNIEKVKVKKKK
jgi:hypothetical protein